jgi:hypothetical protein
MFLNFSPNPAQVELRIPGVQEEPEFSESHFSGRQVVFRLKPGPLLRRFPRKNVVSLQNRKRF